MSNYTAFRKVFKTTKSSTLAMTITNSQKRYAKYDLAGKVNLASVEIDRIQAAADELEARGVYDASAAAPGSGSGVDMKKAAFAMVAVMMLLSL